MRILCICDLVLYNISLTFKGAWYFLLWIFTINRKHDVYILIGNMICIQNEYIIKCCMNEYDE